MSDNGYDMSGLTNQYGHDDVYPPKDKENHLACPFAKHDRMAYELLICACTDRWGFPSISRVNEHIKTSHPDEYSRIKDWKKGLSPNETISKKWYKIYQILFPGADLPSNPYYDFLIPLHRTMNLANSVITSNNNKGKPPVTFNDPSSSWYLGGFSSDLIEKSDVSQRKVSDDGHLVDSHDSGISMGDSFTDKRLSETLQGSDTFRPEDVYDERLWLGTSPFSSEQPTFHPNEPSLGEESEDERRN